MTLFSKLLAVHERIVTKQRSMIILAWLDGCVAVSNLTSSCRSIFSWTDHNNRKVWCRTCSYSFQTNKNWSNSNIQYDFCEKSSIWRKELWIIRFNIIEFIGWDFKARAKWGRTASSTTLNDKNETKYYIFWGIRARNYKSSCNGEVVVQIRGLINKTCS